MFNIPLNGELLVRQSDFIGQVLIIVKVREVGNASIPGNTVLFGTGPRKLSVFKRRKFFLKFR